MFSISIDTVNCIKKVVEKMFNTRIFLEWMLDTILCTSLYVFKRVKNIIANFPYAFSCQFMKSSISSDMFGKILKKMG